MKNFLIYDRYCNNVSLKDLTSEGEYLISLDGIHETELSLHSRDRSFAICGVYKGKIIEDGKLIPARSINYELKTPLGCTILLYTIDNKVTEWCEDSFHVKPKEPSDCSVEEILKRLLMAYGNRDLMKSLASIDFYELHDWVRT